MKIGILTTSLALTAIVVMAFLFGVGPAVGVGAWLWMGVGVRQAIGSSRTKEFDNALVLHEGDFV